MFSHLHYEIIQPFELRLFLNTPQFYVDRKNFILRRKNTLEFT